MKRVLITGGTGALGRMVVEQLKQSENYQIFVTSSQESFRNNNTAVFYCNFYNLDRLSAVLDWAKPDLILHLGAVFTNDLTDAHMLNVAPAIHILDLVQRKDTKTRVVLIGSAAEYGVVTPEESPIREDHVLFPVSVYGLSKAWQTQLLGLYATQGVDVLCARVFNLFGSGVSDRLFAGRIRSQINAVKRREKSVIEIGSLSAVRDYLSTSEAARQLITIATLGISGNVYHIGSGHPKSMREFLIEQLKCEGLSPSLIVESQAYSNHHGYDVPVIFADMHKTQKLEQMKKNV